MKSVISNHEASKEGILQRIDEVILSASLYDFVEFGGLTIGVYTLDNNKYIITFLNGRILTFELENVYCFKF